MDRRFNLIETNEKVANSEQSLARRSTPMRNHLEHYFGLSTHYTTWCTEVLAGFTTFITMAYIIFVNPAILHETGMPIAAITAATCLCAAFASILMGALANYPIALAPGMGLNAYFTYTVVKGMGAPWQTALGAVFLSGVIFLLLTFTGIRQLLVAIPHQLHSAVGGGIGLFITFIGFRNAGIIVPSAATKVTLGNLARRKPHLPSSDSCSSPPCRSFASAPPCSSESSVQP